MLIAKNPIILTKFVCYDKKQKDTAKDHSLGARYLGGYLIDIGDTAFHATAYQIREQDRSRLH